MSASKNKSSKSSIPKLFRNISGGVGNQTLDMHFKKVGECHELFFEYVMVFKLKENEKGEMVQDKYCKMICATMSDAGLSLYPYLSVQQDELFVLIRSSIADLAKFASQSGYSMQLDSDAIKERIEAGQDLGDGRRIKPVVIANKPEFGNLFPPYEYIYGPYELGDIDMFYKRSAAGHAFSKLHRMKLIWNMLQAPHFQGGCDLQLTSFLNGKQIYAMFPLHNQEKADVILAHSANDWTVLPWLYPFDDIKEYFGEKFTLHLQFLGHYASWIAVPAIFGVIFQIVVFSSLNFSSPGLPFFGIIMAAWSIIMLEYWKRHESIISLKWGTTDFEEKEQTRPEYRGEKMTSYVDGSEMLFYPEYKRTTKYVQSFLIILLFMLLILGIVSSIYTLRFYLVDKGYSLSASVVAATLNSLQILITNFIYKKTAKWMTDRENQRTFTEYEDSLVLKTFVFLFVNSYSSFFYIAFVAMYLAGPSEDDDSNEGSCGYESCMEPLAINLAIILLAQMGQQIAKNLIIPSILSWKKKRDETKGVEGKNLTPAEKDYVLIECNQSMDNIENYASTAVEYGYMILFITALPIAVLLGYISVAIRQRSLLWRQFRLYQRIIPTTAQDIGSWQDIFNILSVVAVITNGGLICFTMNVLDNEKFSTAGRIWIFVGIQWTLIGMQGLISLFIPDEPREVSVQKKRMNFIVSKVLRHEEDSEIPVPTNEDEVHHKIPRNYLEKLMGFTKVKTKTITTTSDYYANSPPMQPLKWPPSSTLLASLDLDERDSEGSIRLSNLSDTNVKARKSSTADEGLKPIVEEAPTEGGAPEEKAGVEEARPASTTDTNTKSDK